MEAPETAALRSLLDQYLAGWEPPDTVARRFVSLLVVWFEASHQSTLRGEPALGDYSPPNLTKNQQRRMQELHAAMLDHVPGPDIEWLPLDEDEAVSEANSPILTRPLLGCQNRRGLGEGRPHGERIR